MGGTYISHFSLAIRLNSTKTFLPDDNADDANAPTLWTPSTPTTVSPHRMLHSIISLFHQTCWCTTIPPCCTFVSSSRKFCPSSVKCAVLPSIISNSTVVGIVPSILVVPFKLALSVLPCHAIRKRWKPPRRIV